jgi:homoserine dehydrogenase
MGKCAITANKGPIVHGYRELKDLALAHGGRFLFESTVMDGAPIFSLWREALPGAELQSFRGVLNSTTNLILTLVEDGHTFDEALNHAQSIGIAESDPSGDIEGWDAAVKVAALVTVLMDIPTTPQEIEREGIGKLTVADVNTAKQDGHRWKLICNAQRDGEKAHASVRLEKIDNSDPFYSVMGTSSAVSFSSDVLGDLTIIEENPGPHTTAYGLFADMLNALESTPSA